jgi:hypothetical protein
MARGGGVSWHIDDGELAALEIDLAGAPGRIQRRAPAVLRGKVGPRLDREMKIDATGHIGNWFGKPGTSFVTPTPPISHEMIDEWTVEAGVEPRGTGKFWHIIVFGSANNAPVYDHVAALRRTAPYAIRALGEAAEESVLGDGG